MSEDFNPNSLNAVLASIKTTLENHVNETKEYRRALDEKVGDHGKRIGELESGQKRTLLMALLGGGATGHAGGWLHKIFTGGS